MSAAIEEIHEHDHDHPNKGEDSASQAALDKNQSHAERKARKPLLTLDLKRVPGTTRVTLRRPKNTPLATATPEVFKSTNSDCYTVFGEAKTEDVNSPAQLSDIQHLASSGTGVPAFTEKPADGDVDVGGDDYIPEFEDDDDDDTPEFEDPTHERDIDLVMQQAGCSRARAVQVLENNYGDLIDAIMAAIE